MQSLFQCLKILDTDYSDYGGQVKRWSDPSLDYPDCSRGCKFFAKLQEPNQSDWGVCAKPNAPRSGLLTWEHQAGFGCFEREEDE